MDGAALKRWRTSRGLTQGQAAYWVGVTRNTWARWEHGRNPPPDMLRRVLRAIEMLERAALADRERLLGQSRGTVYIGGPHRLWLYELTKEWSEAGGA